jgi:hypothetical protein
MRLLTDVPGATHKRVVNVPKGYSKEEPKGSEIAEPVYEEVRSSFYNPETSITTLVFWDRHSENWASERIEDLRENYKGLASGDYELFVAESEYPPDIRKAVQNRLKSLKVRLDAIDKIHGVRNKANLRATNPWANCTSLTTFPILDFPGREDNNFKEVPDKLIEPETTEEIMALDTVSFQLWAEDASADQLESFAKWQAPKGLFQKFLNFLRKIGL